MRLQRGYKYQKPHYVGQAESPLSANQHILWLAYMMGAQISGILLANQPSLCLQYSAREEVHLFKPASHAVPFPAYLERGEVLALLDLSTFHVETR